MWLGIDFGTCLSSAAFLKDGIPTPVKFGANITSLPSSVYLDQQGRLLVGDVAERNRQRDPSRYVREFKRELGRTTPYAIGDRELLPEHLVTEILRELKGEAERHFPDGGAVTSAVITVPANYKNPKRDLMKRAGAAAGLTEVELLEEPVAAATYHVSRYGASREGEITLVYDLGGGTFDAALIERRAEGYEPLAMSAGHDRLGGVDFDRKILFDLLERGSETLRQTLSRRAEEGADERERLMRLRTQLWVQNECRSLKHHLSKDEEAMITLPQTGEDYMLGREEFNRMIAPLIQETIEICHQLVHDASLKLEAVDRVLLVGGSCRIPFVQEAVGRGLGRPVVRVDDPELAVCLGAAVHAEAVRMAREEERRRPLRSQYRRAVEIAWADGRLERAEAEKLGQFERELGLGKEAAAAVEREVMGGSREKIFKSQQAERENKTNGGAQAEEEPLTAKGLYESFKSNIKTDKKAAYKAALELLAEHSDDKGWAKDVDAAKRIVRNWVEDYEENKKSAKTKEPEGADDGTVIEVSKEEFSSAPDQAELRVMFPSSFSGIFDVPIKVLLDGALMGASSFRKGVDFSVKTKPGMHILEVVHCPLGVSKKSTFGLELAPHKKHVAHLTINRWRNIFDVTLKQN